MRFDRNHVAVIPAQTEEPGPPAAAAGSPSGEKTPAWAGPAVAAGRLAGRLSRRLGQGDGAIIGGRVVLALWPGALARLATGRRTVIVTGTNGKTTTAHLVAAALRAGGADVAHNATGANMADGAVAALISRPAARFAVLEVDERHLSRVAAAVAPAVVVLLNLSRDQLDRSAEVAAVSSGIRAALLDQRGTVVVANADDPLVTAAAQGVPAVRWVAGGTTWVEDAAVCPRCGVPLEVRAGRWSCSSCGLARPRTSWELRGGDVITPDDRRVPLRLELPGDFNRSNALMALAAAAELAVSPETAVDAFATVRSVAHRYASVRHGAHRLNLLLAKNPAGWREVLPLLRDAPARLLVVNACEADGRDTSWLWDVAFEELRPAPTMASGRAAADLGLRLDYADVDHGTEPDPLVALAALPPGEVTVAANYTAFVGLWGRLDHDRAHRDVGRAATSDRPSTEGGVIRPAVPDDLATTARLHVALLPTGLFPALGTAFVRRWHATYLASPHGSALVAEDPTGRVGAFLIGAVDHRAYMEGLVADRCAMARLAAAGAAGLLRRPWLIGRFLRTRLLPWALWAVLRRTRRPSGHVRSAGGRSVPPTALLDAVAVRPGLRGTGVASELVRRFVAEAADRGIHRVEVVTPGGPSGAAAFYVHLGWHPVGTYRSWDADEVRVLRREP